MVITCISTRSVEYDNIRCIFSVFMLRNVKCCSCAQHVSDLFLLVQVFSCFLHWIKIYSTRNQRAESFFTPASSDEPLPTFIMKTSYLRTPAFFCFLYFMMIMIMIMLMIMLTFLLLLMLMSVVLLLMMVTVMMAIMKSVMMLTMIRAVE